MTAAGKAGALAVLVEQPLRGERLPAPFEKRHQRTLAGKLEPLDNELVL